jgi:enoyl-CoA hydratase/carnithine racemase
MENMDPEPNSVVTTSTGEGITTITINRPHKRNAVNAATGQKIYDAIISFENDPSQKVCIFTGSEGTFCAGADLEEAAQMSSSPTKTEHLQPVGDRNRAPMGPSRLMVKKPVICAVAGYAVAGGLELSLIADMRVVEEDAVFGVFCRRWGVPLIDGGTVRLPAIIGLGRALDMILTGRPVGAQEAYSMGLATRVVPKGKSLEVATTIAKQLLAFPQLCMNLDRSSCYYATYDAKSFEDALTEEYNKGIEVLAKESIAGAAKFSSGFGRHGSFSDFTKL